MLRFPGKIRSTNGKIISNSTTPDCWLDFGKLLFMGLIHSKWLANPCEGKKITQTNKKSYSAMKNNSNRKSRIKYWLISMVVTMLPGLAATGNLCQAADASDGS